MSTSFDRNRAQLRCENFLNCPTLELWNEADFKSFILTVPQAFLLSSDLIEDSKNFYFKGVLGLFEAIKSIEAGLFSWGTIKLYYSIYYFLRSTLALNGVAIVRQKSLYYLKVASGEGPVKKSAKRYNSDHSGTINHFIDLFSASDELLSQVIDDTNAYDWLMQRREQVNYRERTFNEPNYSMFWEYIAVQIQNGNLERLVNDYVQDNYVLCFQEENAPLAIPLKRALLTKDKFDKQGISTDLTIDQKNVLTNLLPFKSIALAQLLT